MYVCAFIPFRWQDDDVSFLCSNSVMVSWYYGYDWYWRERRRLEDVINAPGLGAVPGLEVDDRRQLQCYSGDYIGYSECTCTEESSNGFYCTKWYCEKTTTAGDEDADATVVPDRSWYECTLESASGRFCFEWDAMHQSKEDHQWEDGQLVLSTCTCSETANAENIGNDGYCDTFFCLSSCCHRACGVMCHTSTYLCVCTILVVMYFPRN